MNQGESTDQDSGIYNQPLFWSLSAGTLMLIFYGGVLSIANSAAHAYEQFLYLWHWILVLVTGFSLQAGLFAYIRIRMRELASNGASRRAMAASGGVSASAMVACCAHHLTDLLPVLGLSAAAIFITRFQSVFLLLGVISNFLGIIYMLKVIQDDGLWGGNGRVMGFMMKLNMKKTLGTAALLGSLTLLIVTARIL